MTPQEILNSLDPELKAALKEQDLINKLMIALDQKARELINEVYPEDIHRLSAKGYDELADRISRYSSNLSIDVSNIFYHHTEDRD